MKPTLISSIYFENEADLTEFIVSNELTAKEIRSNMISRLKNGEGIVAVINDSSPRALVLRYTVEPKLKRKVMSYWQCRLPNKKINRIYFSRAEFMYRFTLT